jgi:hypothetical protein
MNPALPKQSMFICKNMERFGEYNGLLKKCFKKGRAG